MIGIQVYSVESSVMIASSWYVYIYVESTIIDSLPDTYVFELEETYWPRCIDMWTRSSSHHSDSM
jgi:hypothetical protein